MRKGSVWQAFVLGVGVAVAGLGGALSRGTYTAAEAAVWTGILLYVFLLSYGANRLQVWMLRPPLSAWRAPFAGVVAFLPMFLGWFPTDGWRMEAARAHGYRDVPSALWMLAVIVWGLFAPGGAMVAGLRRLRVWAA